MDDKATWKLTANERRSREQVKAIKELKVPVWMQIAIAASGIAGTIYIASWLISLMSKS